MQARLPYLVTTGWLVFFFFPFDYLNKKRCFSDAFPLPSAKPLHSFVS